MKLAKLTKTKPRTANRICIKNFTLPRLKLERSIRPQMFFTLRVIRIRTAGFSFMIFLQLLAALQQSMPRPKQSGQ